jgi:hypothetical protein
MINHTRYSQNKSIPGGGKNRYAHALCLIMLLGGAGSLCADEALTTREAETAAEQRIDQAVRFLASDELEGRGLGTNGINVAADYLAKQFRELGLKTDLYDGTPFQSFQVTISSKLGPAEKNQLTLDSPGESDRELKLGTDFTPLALGGSDEFDLPIVFAGYGISSSEDKYDDYQGSTSAARR